ncbi:unnamed protein product [Ambrosiozyma monospora]|uniref:Unnamed protein product n=1 Tax=Ambrosiozyma monospora TaxID=43982 RepID=A0ACB5U6F6_AMBMO|nr:unnamed protein product [Ambrosiozyma monospora]
MSTERFTPRTPSRKSSIRTSNGGDISSIGITSVGSRSIGTHTPSTRSVRVKPLFSPYKRVNKTPIRYTDDGRMVAGRGSLRRSSSNSSISAMSTTSTSTAAAAGTGCLETPIKFSFKPPRKTNPLLKRNKFQNQIVRQASLPNSPHSSLTASTAARTPLSPMNRIGSNTTTITQSELTIDPDDRIHTGDTTLLPPTPLLNFGDAVKRQSVRFDLGSRLSTATGTGTGTSPGSFVDTNLSHQKITRSPLLETNLKKKTDVALLGSKENSDPNVNAEVKRLLLENSILMKLVTSNQEKILKLLGDI